MDKKFKVFVSIALITLTMIMVAGSITLFFFINKSSQAGADGSLAGEDQLEIVYLDESINSNLKIGEEGIPHIIRIGVGFEVNKGSKDYKAFTKSFTTKQIVIRDTILSLLREETYKTINKEELSIKIQEKINTLLSTNIITAVYFNDFFVQ